MRLEHKDNFYILTKIHSKILLILFIIFTSIKESRQNALYKTFFGTEKLSLSSTTINTNSEMAQSHLQLGLRATTKLRTINMYISEYSQLKIDDAQLAQIKTNSKQNSKTAKSPVDEINAYYNPQNFNLEFFSKLQENQRNDRLVASGRYDRSRFETGWDKFYLKTFAGANPIIQCYTAGLIEGILSSDEIYSYYHNIHVFFYNEENYIQDIKNFYKKIDLNIKEKLQVENLNKITEENDFKVWTYITCLNAQINGLFKGYNLIADTGKKLDLYDFYFINSEGNFGDLKTFMQVSHMDVSSSDFYKEENLQKIYNTSNIEKIWKQLTRKGHCSAIAKLVNLPNGDIDIIAGHNTWTEYSEMLRSLKFYDMAFEGDAQNIGMKPRKINFSSYPGVLFSGDDFYEMDSKIAVLQTTLSVVNKFIYKNMIDPNNYIPEFMRLMITNYISDTGKEWVNNYQSFKNHMYITQWIVIDYNVLDKINKEKKFIKLGNNDLGEYYKRSGLTYLLEEVPNSIKSEDVSKFLLNNSFIGSFNVGYFPGHLEILGISHFKEIDVTSKAYNPRFYILKSLHKTVTDLESFAKLLQYNGYKQPNSNLQDDPSLYDPSEGISSRDDLGAGDLHGGVDFKIVNNELINNMTIYVYGGPTYMNNPNTPPFNFDTVTGFERMYRDNIPVLWEFAPFFFPLRENLHSILE
jgi:hypothetical protein